MLIQIGATKLYSSTLNSDYDTWLNSEMDPYLNSELGLETTYILNDAAIQIDHYTDGRATCGFTVYDSEGEFAFFERQQVQIMNLDHTPCFAGLVQSAQSIRFPGSDTKKFWVIDAAGATGEWDIYIKMDGYT